jgi:hypothetical protein
MWHKVAVFTLVAVSPGLVASIAATTDSAEPPAMTRPAESPLLTTDLRLKASLDRIGRGSSIWRKALADLKGAGRHALIVPSADVVSLASDRSTASALPESDTLAEVVTPLRQDSRVPVVLVVVNLPLIETLHSRRASLPREVDADLDRILIHEVYGHAIPYLVVGDLSGHCADPLSRQPAVEACAIQRENAVRNELGLGRRVDKGLRSLTLGWAPLN